MAYTQKGTSLGQTDPPTFTQCVVEGEWRETDESPSEEVYNSLGQLVNFNISNATNARVSTTIRPTTAELSKGDVIQGQSGDTREWIVVGNPETFRRGNATIQSVELLYSSEIQANIP
tara:strand:+ start:1829 stop:2182 length:354 start_codon:yes stop_codon:yes gene_type:complete